MIKLIQSPDLCTILWTKGVYMDNKGDPFISHFYTPVFRRDVLWYGAVRPSVRPSVRPFVRPSDC